MPLANYAVLKGRAVNMRLGSSGSAHYQVLISAGGDMHRIAINVQSQDGSEVEYLVRSNFEHPVTAGLAELEEGVVAVPSRPGGLALDFIRGNIAQPWEFKPLPMSAIGPDNDLNEKLDALVQRAMSDEDAMVHAFGETWGPESKADRYFGFKPGSGIHDIHFNQGNPPGRFAASNGPWQDGGLVFQFPRAKRWVGVFLKFQSQAWHSADDSGGPFIPTDPNHPSRPHTPPDRDRIPPIDVPDGLVRIIAAYVNDVRTPERETVTLLNTADRDIALDGWEIRDSQKHAMRLSGVIAAGATAVFVMAKPVELSNKGGLISLIDDRGTKVHGVSYTRDQARQPGRTIPFQA